MFYKELLLVLHSLRVERDHRAMLVVQKRPVSAFPADSIETQYLQVLTPFAFVMLKPHLASYSTVRVMQILSDTSCEVACSAGIVVSTVDDCPCLFRTSTGLPCRHILAVRADKNLSLFELNLVSERWTRHFYTSRQRVLRVEQQQGAADAQLAVAMVQRPQLGVLTAHQKFRVASVVATELAALVSEAPMRHFETRLQQLRDLCNAWKDDRETVVQVLGERDGEEEANVTGANENAYDDNVTRVDDNVDFGLDDDNDGEEGVEEMAEYVRDWEEQGHEVRQNVRGWDDEVLIASNLVADEYEQVVHSDKQNTEHSFMVTETSVSCIAEPAPAAYSVVIEDDDDVNVAESYVRNDEAEIGSLRDYETENIDASGSVRQDMSFSLDKGASINSTLPLNCIKLPPKMCKRGRPKGAEKTIIGLPKKRRAFSKLVPFIKMSIQEKETVILSWLFSKDIVNSAVRGQLIDEDQVEVRPELLSPALLDENVELKLIHRFLTRDGWLALNKAVKHLKKYVTYFCCVCKIDIGKSLSICCDCCLLWCHLTCSGLCKPSKKKHWFCKMCSLKQ